MVKKSDRQHRKGRRSQASTAGFTLTELMVVIAIIATLATIVGVSVFQHLATAEVTAAKAQITTFKTAIVGYRLEYKHLPTEQEGGLDALINNPKGKEYLDAIRVPLDPWGNEYVYTLINSTKFLIVSFGADGVEGGIDVDADIHSDNLAGDEL